MAKAIVETDEDMAKSENIHVRVIAKLRIRRKHFEEQKKKCADEVKRCDEVLYGISNGWATKGLLEHWDKNS